MSDPALSELDPLVWLARARSCLALARLGHGADQIVLEDLCFNAQQCAEKALKALLISRSVPFPRTHDVSDLLTRVGATGLPAPATIADAAELTVYAVQTRYPGVTSVTDAEYTRAIELADRLLTWVESSIAPPADSPAG